MTGFSVCNVMLALNLLVVGVPESAAFSPALFGSSSRTSTTSTTSKSGLYMSTSTSAAEFELPEDLPNDGNKRSSGGEPSADGVCPLSETRRLRLQVEAEARERFVLGEELHQLRKDVLDLKERLENARMSFATERVKELERAILQAQQVDAEYVYQVAQEQLLLANDKLTQEEKAMWEKESQMARAVLPQFHLEGLWVGKYSDEGGFELINVTYHGDTLVAHKLTSQQQQANVPMGQVTFQVDLSPVSSTSNGNSNSKPTSTSTTGGDSLEPIELGESAAKQWGSKFLSRYAGQGQVAAQGHRNAQWIDGHLILVGEYFSFAWLGIGHQVFFGRPSAELTLQLLKEQQQQEHQSSTDDACREDRAYLARCWEETELLQDELEVQDNVHLEQQDYYAMEGCFE
ncbi:protein EXECUTER 1, chloroplastic-like [Seminavis robusta]|uniref:Protein EXECUTER 1, chloroplastic-like n=1 Tax=Seminavis robusta TaxID=568900 RepID=A0A9N8DCR6_9STRA|nr:protein EXECUTER 1, chloroplastic-like [Seminavis robusta]|eukprot:Sro60_g034480.1 protein EXECUTER 1, chloroplastic-like (403) ;mRNA; f:8493-9701